jgi:hypothetical protein
LDIAMTSSGDLDGIREGEPAVRGGPTRRSVQRGGLARGRGHEASTTRSCRAPKSPRIGATQRPPQSQERLFGRHTASTRWIVWGQCRRRVASHARGRGFEISRAHSPKMPLQPNHPHRIPNCPRRGRRKSAVSLAFQAPPARTAVASPAPGCHGHSFRATATAHARCKRASETSQSRSAFPASRAYEATPVPAASRRSTVGASLPSSK